MSTPAVIPYTTSFEALGHTPAVSLTRSLPHGVDADILLLGCGDVRNILYTAYADSGLPSRKLDITCCDIEPAIIARNVLLFSLLIDGVDADTAMDIYYHLYIKPDSHDIITRQAQKLTRAMSGLDNWRQSAYGSLLDFCDQGSLDLVASILEKYATASRSRGGLSRHLETKKHFAGHATGHAVEQATVLTGMRSSAPFSHLARMDLAFTLGHFWDHGTFLENASPPLDNPLFLIPLSENVALPYSLNPHFGFHLAGAFAKLAPTSPLRVEDSIEMGSQRIMEAARVQFRAWVTAYKELSKSRLVLRFGVADALAFSHTLQCASTGSSPSANMFRRQLDPLPLLLNPKAYGPGGYAPSSFDVIETSTLSDNLGALNLLVAASPLLKDSLQSTLHLEAWGEIGTTPKAQFDALLKGDAPSMLLLLGLAPAEYWTGTTILATVHELYCNARVLKGKPLQHQSRLSFKLASHFLRKKPWLGRFSVDAESLAMALRTIYSHMFHEDALTQPQPSIEEVGFDMGLPVVSTYHQCSFVVAMKLMQTKITTDWPLFWEQLLRLIQQDAQDRSLTNLYFQELRAQLHLHDLYTEPGLRPRVNPTAAFRGPSTWKEVPEVVCVTLVVPRDHVNKLYSTEQSKKAAPVLEAIVTCNESASHFTSAQIVFGSVECQGNLGDETTTVVVKPDLQGWQGNSTMAVSFYVPTNILFVDPDHTQIGLGVQRTTANMKAFQHLEEYTKVFSTPLSNSSNITISKFLPGTSGYPVACGRANAGLIDNLPESVPLSMGIKTTLALDRDRVASMCRHVDFECEIVKKLLTDKAPIKLRQSTPTTMEIVFGKKALVYPVSFPVPVSKKKAKTRIARKAGYIEIVARFAEPTVSTVLEAYLHPVALGPDSIPVIINGDHINLESLPILNVEALDQRDIEWLAGLASDQFTPREKEIRNHYEAFYSEGGPIDPSFRIEMKEFIFFLLATSIGFEGRHTGLFSISHPTQGIRVLIFVRAIRLHGAAGSIIADAACLPLTRELIQSKVLDTFLSAVRDLEIRTINVEDTDLSVLKSFLSFTVERCRTWNHKPSCEYKKPRATIPLSVPKGEAFLCTCGNGILPENYMNLPEWDEASKHMVRIAISPIFPVPIVETVIDPALLFTNADGRDADGLPLEKCAACNATGGKDGKQLLKCSRCREASYCSVECQKKDWKKHRTECSPPDN